MSVSRYRLTTLGWIGAVLFVLPTPAAAWLLGSYFTQLKPGEQAFNDALGEVGGSPAIQAAPSTLLVVLATLSLIGLVMLLVGREIVTDQ